MSRHYTEEELEQYADDPTDQGVEAHLSECVDCSNTFDRIRGFTVNLEDGETWQLADALRDASGIRAMADLRARIAEEDAEAESLLRVPLETPYRFLRTNIIRKRRFQSGGVVRVLCRVSKDERERDALHARNLADVAAVIAEALPDDYYPARAVNHLRGLAWKELANALRYLGEFSAAMAAVDRAERAYRRLLMNETELAVMRYVRGTILWKQQRLADALNVAKAAADDFARLRDYPRWIDAKQLQGSIFVDLHDGRAARDVFQDLYENAHAMSDPVTAARIANNLGQSYIEIGDPGSASKYLLEAFQVFEGLDIATEVARVRWSLGLVALIGGNAAEAERRLRAAAAELGRLQLATDEALAVLDLAEALVVLERREDVRQLCSELPARFQAAGMEPAALTAAAYLREASVSRTLTRRDVQHVRQFLRTLEADPRLLFLPPRE